MTKVIETHIVEGDTQPQIEIRVLDEAGAGGAHHVYGLIVPEDDGTLIRFQNGPIKEVGVNGLTQEALLAVVIHRLECFQAGPFACEENETALKYVELALYQLQTRTRKRVERGVEGTNVA